MSERHGDRPATPDTVPAPVVTGKARTAEWVLDRRQGGEPAHTMASQGLAKGRDVWMRANAQAAAAVRPAGTPAPTITGGHDTGDRVWTHGRPATVVQADPRIAQPGHTGNGSKTTQMAGAVRVTVEQAAVLQTFPPDYPWQGSRTKQFEQVGNAVPPMLAEAVLQALLNGGES